MNIQVNPVNLGMRGINNKSLGALKLSKPMCSSKNFGLFWPVFTQYIFSETKLSQECSIVSKKVGESFQLFLENGKGEKIGALSDPLKIASRMAELGVDKISFGEEVSPSQIEKTLKAVMGGGFKLGANNIYCLQESPEAEPVFSDKVNEFGLPLFPGVKYSLCEQNKKNGQVMTPDEFRSAIRDAQSSVPIIRLLAMRVIPFFTEEKKEGLNDYLAFLLAKAKWFNEEKRDIDSAIEIWLAIYRLNISENENLKIVKTMMDVANKFADHRMAKEKRNIDVAINIWLEVCKLNVLEEEKQRVVLTMMDVANKLTDQKFLTGAKDVDSAIKIWLAVYKLNVSEEEKQRVILTMMDVANKIDEEDIDSALKLWLAIYRLNMSESENETVIKTMMDVANKLTGQKRPIETRNVDSAIKIWLAVYHLNVSEDMNLRVLKTMMQVANLFTNNNMEKNWNVESGIRIWLAVYRLHISEEEDHRIIGTIMDIASRSIEFCREAINIMTKENKIDAITKYRLLAGLLYYLENYDEVISLANAHALAPQITLYKAEAYRKLGRYHEAINLCNEIKKKLKINNLTVEDTYLLVDLYACLGYCFLEIGQYDEAIKIFKQAITTSEKVNINVPPRVITGLGFVCERRGDVLAARKYHLLATLYDPDNQKAKEALTELLEQNR